MYIIEYYTVTKLHGKELNTVYTNTLRSARVIGGKVIRNGSTDDVSILREDRGKLRTIERLLYYYDEYGDIKAGTPLEVSNLLLKGKARR